MKLAKLLNLAATKPGEGARIGRPRKLLKTKEIGRKNENKLEFSPQALHERSLGGTGKLRDKGSLGELGKDWARFATL